MSHAAAADTTAAPEWSAPLSPLVGVPRDRPQRGALPTDVNRFRELVWQPLATADPSGRRWLSALGAFELLRHGAAEPDGVLHATGRSIASMLRIAETTWCRSTRTGQAGYGPLLETAGLLVREGWEHYRLPSWEALQNRAADATLQGRFVYTHRPTFRATVVRWRLSGVSLAALGAWSLLRYCHTRWDTAELPLCDAAIARRLGIKPHTWAGWAGELARCGALQRLRPTPGSGYRLPLYFVLRTGRGFDQALADPVDNVVDEGPGARADPEEAAVQLHATSADPHAEPAAGLSLSRTREDPVVDGGHQEHPGGDVERTLDRLAAAAGDAWQQEQVRASATLRARCRELLERTGWSPTRLAAELSRRELRTAREPVRVLAYRARALLDAAPTTEHAAAEAPQAVAARPPGEHDHAPQATEPAHEPNTPATATELDALDEQARSKLLEAARARLRRIGLPRSGDFSDDHPLLRGEALNLLRGDTPTPTDQPAASPDCAWQAGVELASAGDQTAAQRQAGDPEGPGAQFEGVRAQEPGEAPPAEPLASAEIRAGDARATPRPGRYHTRRSRHEGGRRRSARHVHRTPDQPRRSLRPSRTTGFRTGRGRTPRVASRPRSRDPPRPGFRLWPSRPATVLEPPGRRRTML